MKNIIFDFGNVIIRYDEDNIISKFTNDPKEIEFIKNEIINSPEWIGNGLMDTGFISHEDAASLINDRTNNKYNELVNIFLQNYQKYMILNENVINIIKLLKEKGYKIYMLSNTNELTYNNFIYKIKDLFDGLVLSYEINMIKPYNGIYNYLLNKYNLKPEESLFIDDRLDNMETANKLGINGRKIIPNSEDDIKQVLKEYGVLND